MKIHICERCHTPIAMRIVRGNVHIECPCCHQKYSFTQQSLKLYTAIPFLCVALAVAGSIAFLKNASIDIKLVFILGVSFVSAALLELVLVRAKLLQYERKEEDEHSCVKKQKQ